MFPGCSGDLTSPKFSPEWFLLEHHPSTSFDDLRAGLACLRRKVEAQKEGQISFLKVITVLSVFVLFCLCCVVLFCVC